MHRETTRALPDLPLLEHGEHLLEHGRHFGLSRKDHVRRHECADLQSCLAVMVVSTVHLRNLSRPPYLPSSANATDLRICCGQFLAQISGFPQFFQTQQLLLSQVRIDRVQPFVEVAYDSVPAHCQTGWQTRWEVRLCVLCELPQVDVEFMLVKNCLIVVVE